LSITRAPSNGAGCGWRGILFWFLELKVRR
jgi:hypothetical protein